MTMIEIESFDNGGHRNQTSDLEFVPNGWAIIPDGLETPNFPFGDIEVDESDGTAVVTRWTPRDLPEVTPTEKPITLDERVTALENAVLELALGGTE